MAACTSIGIATLLSVRISRRKRRPCSKSRRKLRRKSRTPPQRNPVRRSLKRNPSRRKPQVLSEVPSEDLDFGDRPPGDVKCCNVERRIPRHFFTRIRSGKADDLCYHPRKSLHLERCAH